MGVFRSRSSGSAPTGSCCIPVMIRRSNHNRHTFSVCSHLLGSHIVFVNSTVSSSITGSIVTRLLFLRVTSPGGSVRICVGSPKKSIATNLTVCSAVRFISYSMGACYLNVTTSVNSILLTTKAPNGHFYLPGSRMVVRRISKNTRKATSSIRHAVNFVFGLGGHLGNVLTGRANGARGRVRGSTSHSGCVATRRTITCNLISGILTRRSSSRNSGGGAGT